MKTITVTTVTVAQSTGTLTWDNAAGPTNNKVVVIGSTTYTFKTTLTPAAGEVLLNGGGDASLLNLIRAINHTGTPGTDYANLGVTAVANTQVTAASSVTANAFAVTAIERGLDGNDIVTTTDDANLSWGAATLVGGEAVSITGTVAAATFTQPSQQVTVGDFPSNNQSWSRAVRLSNQGFFCLRNGAQSVALLMASWSKIAYHIEPTLTFAPDITTDPVSASVAAPAAAAFSVVAASETTTTYQWQEDTGSGFVNVTDGGVYSGATTASLAISDSTGKNGYDYQCVATNESGSSTSESATLTVT